MRLGILGMTGAARTRGLAPGRGQSRWTGEFSASTSGENSLSSYSLARANALVVVGDVNSAALARTRMAKSVLDAGWTTFRSMLRYKLAMRHGARFVETNERYSTQTCCACGARTGPRGIAGLRVREWECSSCGAVHDRDINAARNILVSGRNVALHSTEIPAL